MTEAEVVRLWKSLYEKRFPLQLQVVRLRDVPSMPIPDRDFERWLDRALWRKRCRQNHGPKPNAIGVRVVSLGRER